MSFEVAANTSRTRFMAQFPGLQGDVLIGHENVTMVTAPTVDESWVRTSVREVSSELRTLGGPGNRTFEDVGFFVVEIFTPTNDGDVEARRIADSVRSIFLGVSVGGVVYETPRYIPVGVDKEEGYYKGICQIPFTSEFQG